MSILYFDYESRYYKALFACFERYLKMIDESPEPLKLADLRLFTGEALERTLERHPIAKLCRWLGYIQGVLIERGLTTVRAERDWTRPYFRPLDFPDET